MKGFHLIAEDLGESGFDWIAGAIRRSLPWFAIWR